MTGLADLTPAERYRELADAFTATVNDITDWDAPTPVKEWRARDIIAHLASWLPAVLTSGSEVEFLPMPNAESDPVETWDALNAQVQGLMESPELAQMPFENAEMGAASVGEIIDDYFTPDIFMHRWDLAKSNGLDATLDPGFVHHSFAGMSQIESMLRQSGQFGAQRQVAEDASEQDRFIAFIGRDPYWERPAH